MPTFTEQLKADQLTLLSKVKHLTQPQQRRAYLFEHNPYTEAVKKRAWREMAKTLTADRPVKRDYSNLPPEERAWREKNEI